MQFFPREDIPWALKKGNQNPEGLLLQLDLDAILAQLSCAQVDFEETEANGSRLGGIRHVPSPLDCSTRPVALYTTPHSQSLVNNSCFDSLRADLRSRRQIQRRICLKLNGNERAQPGTWPEYPQCKQTLNMRSSLSKR